MPCSSASKFGMEKLFSGVIACVLFSALSLSAQGQQLFKGQITSCTCAPPGDHTGTPTGKGSTPYCPPPCTNSGGKYVLSNAANQFVFQFDNQDFPRTYAGQHVYVIGTLDRPTGTIHINNIVPDVSPIIRRAKTVSIVCDACPRAMSKAKPAALEELLNWERFTVVSDPKTADLIFLFSANRYLGDYLTRDGPDTRPVHIEITYRNIIDPHTGLSLWGDSEREGSWFVVSATKDLINELRELMEAGDNPAERKLFLARHWVVKVDRNSVK
jgi:hypothetical protein